MRPTARERRQEDLVKPKIVMPKKTTLIATTILILLGTWARPASAQSDREIRKENQALRTQVTELRRELDAARQQIEALNVRIAELESQLRSGGTSGGPRIVPPPPVVEVTIDESVPTASPRALFNSIVADYEETMGDKEIGNAGDRSRIAYLRHVENWQAKVNREFREPIDWHVKLLERQPAPRGMAAYLVAVDPVTGAELGDPFWAHLQPAIARRVEAMLERTKATVFQLKGVLRPAVTLDVDRMSPGPFDSPKYIGPFAEFEFTVDAHSLTEPIEDEEDEGDEQPGG